MVEQQSNPKRSVTLAAVFTLLAVVAFAAAFYLLDGMSLVEEYLAGPDVVADDERDPGSETPGSPVDADTLRLPEGMTEEFALRMWQEQIDSQANIVRLAEGDVSYIEFAGVDREGDSAILGITAGFTDGTSAQGKLGMDLIGEKWYFQWVSGLRGDGEAPPPDTPLPSVEDVDVAVLNTILEQQADSEATLREYAEGVVTKVRVEDVVRGPDTVTLHIEMEENHDHSGFGEVVLISKEIDGRKLWFVARFTKQGEKPL
jgi:hypothetical protein